MSCILTNCLSARLTLGIMAFLMFLVTQMIRVNLYIVLVVINSEQQGNFADSFVASDYVCVDIPINDAWHQDLVIVAEDGAGVWESDRRAIPCQTPVTLKIIVPKEDYKSNWNENASGLLLGAFYWSYWATELPGGLLAQKFGGRKVLGVGVTTAAVLNLLLPLACRTHYLLASFLRALQGLALGVTWPVMHWLSARWIPQSERSKFMTSYHGAAVGTAITYPLSGIIITYFGWEYVFYFVGAVTIAWCFAWWILIFDSPSTHPRISEKESNYLKTEIGESVANKKGKEIRTPWRAIISSKPVWAVLVASQGLMWGTITLSMQMPRYFNQVHHLDIKTNGLLSGVPEIGKFFFALIFSSFIDRIISKKIVTVTAARKLAVVFCEYIPGALLLILGFFGSSNTVFAVVLLSLTCSVGGASSSGSLANIVDLSPNHAGTILGIIKTLTIIPGVVSPLIATYFTRNSENSVVATNWRWLFVVMAGFYTFCCTIFLIFGSGEVQPWNQPQDKSKDEAPFLEVVKLPPSIILMENNEQKVDPLLKRDVENESS